MHWIDSYYGPCCREEIIDTSDVPMKRLCINRVSQKMHQFRQALELQTSDDYGTTGEGEVRAFVLIAMLCNCDWAGTYFGNSWFKKKKANVRLKGQVNEYDKAWTKSEGMRRRGGAEEHCESTGLGEKCLPELLKLSFFLSNSAK